MYIRLALILVTLIIGNIGHANIPNAVLTKSSSACATEANGSALSLTLCFENVIELIERYINYNLSNSPASKKKEWQQAEKKILAKCNSENNDLSDPFYHAGYAGCVRDEYSKFNRKLLNIKE